MNLRIQNLCFLNGTMAAMSMKQPGLPKSKHLGEQHLQSSPTCRTQLLQRHKFGKGRESTRALGQSSRWVIGQRTHGNN